MTINYLDIDYLKSLGVEPQYFGLGFIQLKLNDRERIHFYSNELNPIVSDDEIHNHRYNFTSKILKGTLRNIIWYYEIDDNGGWELIEVSCQPNKSTEPKIIIPAINAIKLNEFDTIQGQSYHITKNAYHQVVPKTNKVITFLTRDIIQTEYANVIKAKNVPSICPFSAPISEKECWDWIHNIIYDGYHIQNIEKGQYGEASKILEETNEFIDANNQNNRIMEMCELADLYGAIEAYADKFNINMDELRKMNNATKRAFEQGRRN